MDVDFPKQDYLDVSDFTDTQIAMAQARGLSPRQLLKFVIDAQKQMGTYVPPAKRPRLNEGGRKTRRARKNKKRQQKKSRRNYK